MNLAGKELLEFVRTKQALARDEIIRFREEKKRDEARIAEEAERARHHKKEDDEKIAAEAERIWRHKTEDEERIRIHEKEVCHLRIEADNIRRRRVLQEVWENAEERRREEEDEDECSIPVTDRELWRKCFREQQALAREEVEEIRQHKEYRLQRAYERLQWEKEDVARNAAKEEKEKVMQHEDVMKTAEIQRVEVMKTAYEVMQHEEADKTAEDEKMQPVKVMKTAAEDALRLEMVTPDSEASYETEDGGDASEQEANHHPTDDDDKDGRMNEGQEKNGVGQERGPSLPAPSVRRSSKIPEDRQRFSSRRDHSPKRSSLERDRRMDGRRRLPLSKKSRYSSWARKIGTSRQVKKMMTMEFF